MNQSLRNFVRQRAESRCEYCKLHQEDSPLAALHIEHIVPRKHGGGDDLENLCLACIDCNLHKGPNLTGIDPVGGEITPLFHPRQQEWDGHFAWDGVFLIGKTPTGRATIRVLRMNSDERLELRMAGG